MRPAACLLLLGCTPPPPGDTQPLVWVDALDAYATVEVNEIVATPPVEGGSAVGVLMSGCRGNYDYDVPPSVYLLSTPLVGEVSIAERSLGGYEPADEFLRATSLSIADRWGGEAGRILAWSETRVRHHEVPDSVTFGTAATEGAGELDVRPVVVAGEQSGLDPAFPRDFDGDGVEDLLVTTDDYLSSFLLFPGPLTESTALDEGIPLEPKEDADSVGLSWRNHGDVNGDGYADIGTSTGLYFGHASLGTSIPAPLVTWSYSESLSAVSGGVVGDLDGDSVDDISLNWSGQHMVGFGDIQGDDSKGWGGAALYTSLHPGVYGIEDATAVVGGWPNFDFIGVPTVGADLDGSGIGDLLLGYVAGYDPYSHSRESAGGFGAAIFLDPLAHGAEISFLQADLVIFGARESLDPTVTAIHVFENNDDGVPDVLLSGAGGICTPGPARAYDGATLLGKLRN